MNKVRKILEEFKKSDGEILFGYDGYYSFQEKKISQAIQSISKYYKSKMPSIKKIAIELYKVSIYAAMYGGWDELPEGHQRVFIMQAEAVYPLIPLSLRKKKK